jgi:maleylpyruvate isomerase
MVSSQDHSMETLTAGELALVHDHVDILLEREAWMRSTVASMDVLDLTVPSVLPDWSIAHVLVHMARNADSHRRRIEAAARGEVVDQYQGGVAGRTREIEDGVERSRAAIIDDVVETSLRLDAAWPTVTATHWLATSRDVSGKARTLRTLPMRRLQEVEVHVVDLGIGVTQEAFSDALVHEYLEPMRSSVTERLPLGASLATEQLNVRDELWWLYGRGKFDGHPELAPLGVTTDRSVTRREG